MDTDSIFLQNEIDSNKLLSKALLVITGGMTIVLLLVRLQVFYVYHWNINVISIAMVLIGLLMIATSFLARHFNYEKKWLKIVLMMVVMLALGLLDSIFTYTASINIIIPIILSSRYFSKRYTVIISIASICLFFITAILGAMYGNYDINNLELPKHTIIDMGEEIWIADVIDAGGLQLDTSLQVKNVLLYDYVPRLIATLIVMSICIAVTEHGRRMILKQKTLSEQNARIAAELDLATKIQEDALPNLFPAFPDRPEFDLFASMNPAKEVGGDFYDFFLVDDDHLVLEIADVSGKGVPAAMFMMFSKNIIANNMMLGKSPAQALQLANSSICANNSEDMFVTVWLGLLTISTGEMICVNAGHEYPIIKRRDGSFELFKDRHGMAIGWFDDMSYDEYELSLQPGDKLFVYTDGVSEATDSELEMYGMDTIVEALNRNPEADPEQMISGIWTSVSEFVGEAEQFDDLTMLAFEYKGII